MDAKKAKRSGWLAAQVFGATSEKIKIMKVSNPAAIAIPDSPYRRKARMVAIDEAKMLIKLLPNKIRPINRSGFFNRVWAILAPKWPLLTRCISRYLFKRIKAVSEPEKKADNKIRMNNVEKRNPSERSVTACGSN